jgi:hypothetical protein
MEDDLKKRRRKKEDDLKKMEDEAINQIGCDTIVYSPSTTLF